MKSLTIFSLVILMFGMVACGGGEAEQAAPKDLGEARTRLQEKKDELRTLETEIEELETLIAELDTTKVQEKTVLVTTRSITPKDFVRYVEVQGNVMTKNDPAFASSETGGRIIEMKVKEGSYVKEGDLIAKVDLESIRKSIAELDKSLELATDIYERQKNLWEQNIGSELQFLQAKNQVESLETTKERLTFELEKASVYAPASGYIEMVMVKSGEMAGPGTPIVQILNTNALKVVAAIPENYLGNIKKGQKVDIQFPAIGKEQVGTIFEIGRTINPTNRTFEVEISVSNMGGLLKPNLLATVMVKEFEQKEAIVIPAELIAQDINGNDYVMLNNNGRATRRNIMTGINYQNEVIIDSGLTASDVLLIKGARQATEGDLLKITAEEQEVVQN